MFKNYFKVALRTLVRNKLTSVINIAGLALAMICSLMIFLFIADEMSYDRYHEKADNIYRVTRNFLSQDGTVNLHLGHVAPPFGPLLKNDFSDIEEVARVLQFNVLFSIEENGEKKVSFNEANTFVAEPEIFKIFSIPVIEGSPDMALSKPFTVMLSDKMAMKYFGTLNVQGKRLKADNAFDLEVTGIFESFPAQSHWHPDFLVSFSTLHDDSIYGRTRLETNWGNNGFATYILVNDQFDRAKVEAQFPAFIDKHMGHEGDATPSSWTNLFLQPLTDIHLHSHLDSEIEANGNIRTVYIMGVIGIFIILIACFNFINLSTARATKRSKEVGLRKVAGAFRSQLIAQHLSESVLTALFAMVLAVIFSGLALGWLNDFTNKSIALHLTNNASLLGGLLFISLLIGILAGLYPAFVISSQKPALILKGSEGASRGKGSIRKILVVAQFTISITLIIATLITHKQLNFVNNQELGYNKDRLLTLDYFSEDLGENYDAFYNEITRSSAIKNASRSSRVPTGRLLDYQGGGKVYQGDSLITTSVVLKNIMVDHEFFDTYSISMASGRNFSKEIATDDSLAFVLNEAAVRMIGWTNEEAVNQSLEYGGVMGQVIGVAKDFHFESLHEPIIPMIFLARPGYDHISVQIAGNDMKAGIEHIENTWKTFLPQRPFEYEFLSDQYKALYESEQIQNELYIIFAGLAIFIASMGLFGLATFNTLQRVKEIGIRKVLGASVTNILGLLSKEIVVLIIIANLIAWPIAWYMMNEWLKNFAYKVSMPWGVYLVAALIAVVLAVFTVSVQTVQAAMTNPSKTLRQQ